MDLMQVYKSTVADTKSVRLDNSRAGFQRFIFIFQIGQHTAADSTKYVG